MNGEKIMTTPTFDTRHSYAGLRAFVILGLCAALTAGFLFETWQTPTQVQLACQAVNTAAKC
jgi:uncharacterized membrane protein YeaQ/YmgE (transglycosylase-associated protein family)